MNRLQAARRELDRLEWEHDRATRAGHAGVAYGLEPSLRDARWRVEDLEAAEATSTVRAARRTALLLDGVLGVVAGIVMAFSLRNIAVFAAGHGVVAPLPWLLAPMVDLALVGTLTADAFLSRNKVTPGRWEAALRWFAGVGTLVLNDWDAVVSGAPGNVVAHTVPPLLLLLLAEAAPRYRRGAVAAVDTVRTEATRTRTHPSAPAASYAPDPVMRTSDVPESAASEAADEAADEPTETADQPAAAPASDTVAAGAAEAASDSTPTPAGAAPPKRSAPRTTRPRAVPGAGRTVRAVRGEDELLSALRDLRTGADGPVSQRAALAALGIGAPRLKALLSAHGLTLDPLPLPAPRSLHPVGDPPPGTVSDPIRKALP
ncbi:hypothetical protein POF50_004570 [Streptomyces sp. SL13]|uniref:DUF2637 domain-containing protein n=1 Tax=Streptantibioticus silvisoli TaxID=2705255 RepID=A0AA90KF04_9ACTN|nr:hypothetical protein [Streptantibioticus silvisoli]MDI5968625.1 hypothetical protein [Streptantibioticus silvisoli]